jgi:hypothetical protein
MRLQWFAIVLALPLVACDKKEESVTAAAPNAAAPAATPEPKVPDPPPAAEPAPDTTPPAAKEVELVPTDLSAAHTSWKGWTVAGPKGAKVMVDGVKSARVAEDGMAGLDVIFDQKKQDLKLLKKNLEAGAKASNGETKHTYLKEEADELAWKTDAYGSTSYNFARNRKVGGKDVSCSGNPMMGFGSTEQVDVARKMCESLSNGAGGTTGK